jgi:hypothetical protein
VRFVRFSASRKCGVRLGMTMILGLSLGLAFPSNASAHNPDPINPIWTCNGGQATVVYSGGVPALQSPGNCYVHESGSFTSYRFDASVPAATAATIRAQFAKWSNPYGNQYYMTESSGSNNVVRWVGYQICGTPNAIACTNSAVSAGHISVMSTDFRNNAGANLSWAAIHEAGHAAGLGHAAGTNVMGTGGVNLGGGDFFGLCQIYGHSHAQWGGCYPTN